MTERLFFGPVDDPDRYELVAQITATGGTAWKASRHIDGVHVPFALKVLEGDGSEVAAWASTWGGIAGRLAVLDHPGLAAVREHFVAPGPHGWKDASPRADAIGVVTQWIAGEPMADWLRARPELTTPERVVLVQQTAAAVEALHAGIATGEPVPHGDISMTNLLSFQDEPVLVGYRFARLGPAAEGTLDDDRRALGQLSFSLLTGRDFTDDAEANVIALEAVEGFAGRPELQRHVLDLAEGVSVPGNMTTWSSSLSMLLDTQTALPSASSPDTQLVPREHMPPTSDPLASTSAGAAAAVPTVDSGSTTRLVAGPVDPAEVGLGPAPGLSPVAAATYAAFLVALVVFLVSLFVG